MSKDKVNIPKASSLMGSLRSMGYTFESAVADIIDNSISAHSSFVKILFPQNPLDAIAVGILDDGDGMTREELFEAMRYGSMASEEERDQDDLGRFGMGMKAASLSQCRNLTVVSYDINSNLSAYTWDYVYIQKKQDWIIQELSKNEIEKLPFFDALKGQRKGTLVLWQDFDVLSKSSDGQVYDTLMDLRKSLEKSLALIFHRYLSQSSSSKLKIHINNQTIKPLDPFLERHPKTTSKKERTIAINDTDGKERLIRIKPFILPFATDMSESDKKLIGGIENLRSKQGFYVYRNNRLIIWGTWFGMKQRAELTKNARIRVDIPNTLDDIWGIDIKKQNASIPKRILHQLRKTVMDALEISVNQQTYRGRKAKVNDDMDYIWDRKEGRNQTFFYQINRESKLFQFVKERMSETDYGYLEMLVTEIERNIPTQQMYIDKSNEAIAIEETDSRFDDVYQIAVTMAVALKKVGSQSYKEIIDGLMKSEPFCNYPKLTQKLTDNFKE
mgnify:FL=1